MTNSLGGAQSNIARIQVDSKSVTSFGANGAARNNDTRSGFRSWQDFYGVNTGKPDGYNPKSSKTFTELIDLNTYSSKLDEYKKVALAEENKLNDYESKVALQEAPGNSGQFNNSYQKIIQSSNLKEFYRQQTLFWKSEQSFIEGNPDKLTKNRADSYKNLQNLESRYEAEMLAGHTVKAASLKSSISGMKRSLQRGQLA